MGYWFLQPVPLLTFLRSDIAALGMTAEERDSYIAESKVMRAWHYLKLMDMYGNIPVATEVAQGAPTNPATKDKEGSMGIH